MKQVEEKCHCGRDIYRHTSIVNEDGSLFTRGLCQGCDDVRCDAYPGACNDHEHDDSVGVMTEDGALYLRCSICNQRTCVAMPVTKADLDAFDDHVHDYSVRTLTEGGVTYLRCSICNQPR